MPATAALITVLILGRPLCVECIAMRANVTPRRVMSYLRKIDRTVHVERSDDDRCRACGQPGRTYWLSRVD